MILCDHSQHINARHHLSAMTGLLTVVQVKRVFASAGLSLQPGVPSNGYIDLAGKGRGFLLEAVVFSSVKRAEAAYQQSRSVWAYNGWTSSRLRNLVVVVEPVGTRPGVRKKPGPLPKTVFEALARLRVI